MITEQDIVSQLVWNEVVFVHVIYLFWVTLPLSYWLFNSGKSQRMH